MSALMHVYLTHPPIHTNVCIIYIIQIYTYIFYICIFVHVCVCMHTCIFSPKNLYCIYFSETYFYLPSNHVHIPTLFIITYVPIHLKSLLSLLQILVQQIFYNQHLSVYIYIYIIINMDGYILQNKFQDVKFLGQEFMYVYKHCQTDIQEIVLMNIHTNSLRKTVFLHPHQYWLLSIF